MLTIVTSKSQFSHNVADHELWCLCWTDWGSCLSLWGGEDGSALRGRADPLSASRGVGELSDQRGRLRKLLSRRDGQNLGSVGRQRAKQTRSARVRLCVSVHDIYLHFLFNSPVSLWCEWAWPVIPWPTKTSCTISSGSDHTGESVIWIFVPKTLWIALLSRRLLCWLWQTCTALPNNFPVRSDSQRWRTCFRPALPAQDDECVEERLMCFTRTDACFLWQRRSLFCCLSTSFALVRVCAASWFYIIVLI